MKRALVFLAITFGITYAYDFLVVYPIAQGTAPYASEFLSPDLAYMVSVALTMLFPALGVVLTRLVTREGFQMCAWCTVLAIFLSYVTIRTGSTFAAAIGQSGRRAPFSGGSGASRREGRLRGCAAFRLSRGGACPTA